MCIRDRCYDERDLNRELCVNKEIEVYNLKRDYDEWKVRLEVCLNNDDLIYLYFNIWHPNWDFIYK